MAEKITQEQWVERCAQRLASRLEEPVDNVREIAEICFEQMGHDEDTTPEDAADEELSCWE